MRRILLLVISLVISIVSIKAQSKDSIQVLETDKNRLASDNSNGNINAEFGIVLGVPSAINLVFAKHIGDFLFKLSGGFLGSGTYGAQFEVGYKFYEEKETYQAIGLGVGHSVITTNKTRQFYAYESYAYSNRDTWDYIALNYMLNTKGFYLNAGLSHGSGTFTSPQIVLQIGYVIQIR